MSSINEDGFEEISVEEVDRIVAALDELIQSVDSETIRYYLETTAEEISYLIDEEDEDPVDGEAEAA